MSPKIFPPDTTTGNAQMTAILTKTSWSPKLSNGVVIVMENQT